MLVGCVLASIAVGAVLGNALVILSVLTNPKLRTITNRFVASLACADLSVGVLVMPLAVKVGQHEHQGPNLQNILRFIVRLS